ncbi:MAG TPA: TIGR03808 family TAT-translocated repetitive protein, partial [Xanthobacteraceae bacterium]|nr:TIGR03808 family TAT-translocated repetitive protein [Xanthobacteraceae bacterium]
MDYARRRLLGMSAIAAAATPIAFAAPQATPSAAPAFGIDATQLGLVPGHPDDQTRVLQRAVDHAARSRTPLILAPGVYRAGGIKLPSGAQLIGVHGATRLMLSQGASIFESSLADHVMLSGLALDGGGRPLPEGRGLVHLTAGRGFRILDCFVTGSGRQGIVLDRMEGEVRGTSVFAAAGAGLFSIDARGVVITGNSIRGCGNNGIQVWRSEIGDDGTIVAGNRIEDVAAKAGGSGQNGNAINVFRAANVYVGQNRIRAAAFSAVRGNAASNLQVTGNSCVASGEVAIYAEFG